MSKRGSQLISQVKDLMGYMAPRRTIVLRRLLQRSGASAMMFSLRKEVIQPQVLLRLPCYDFTPIMNYTLDGYPPCGLAYRLLVQPTFVM